MKQIKSLSRAEQSRAEQSRAEQSRAEPLSCLKTKFLGSYNGNGPGRSGAVFDKEHLSPTLNTCGGGGTQPHILSVECVAMRGRGENNEQQLEIQKSGCTNTITSVAKDNLVMETKKMVKIREANKKGYAECEIGGVADLNYVSSTTRRGRVQMGGQISPTLCAENTPSVIEFGNPDFYNFLYEIDGNIYLIRIRKLTPRECWSLMDFNEGSFDKAQEVNSNTQLYKQAGNSIVVNCLVGIFGQLFEGKEEVYKEI